MYSTLLILPTKANNSILIPVIRPHESQVQRCLDLFKAIKNMFVITISHPVIAGCISHYTLPDSVRTNTTEVSTGCDISTPTICITSILLPVIHMMKLEVQRWVTLT